MWGTEDGVAARCEGLWDVCFEEIHKGNAPLLVRFVIVRRQRCGRCGRGLPSGSCRPGNRMSGRDAAVDFEGEAQLVRRQVALDDEDVVRFVSGSLEGADGDRWCGELVAVA